MIHYTAMASTEAARDWLCNPKAEVSAHYLIGRSGACWHLVEEELRAWHAGAGEWDTCDDVNSASIGIELANTGTEPFPDPQMSALETLLTGILARWTISPHNVIGHSDMAPGRKIDPGKRFDWARLERQGLARKRTMSAPGALPATDSFRSCATACGFTAPVDDQTLLASVRLRYRPWATGPLTPEDITPLLNTE